MKFLKTFAVAVALVLIGVGASGAETENDPALTAYRDALLAQLDRLDAALPEMTKSAEAAADRLIAGGALYVGGEEAFRIEAYIRAGGLMMTALCDEKTVFRPNDILMVGAWTSRDASALALCRRAKDAGAYVVLFAPDFAADAADAACCDAHICNFAAGDGMAFTLNDGRRVGPLSPLFTVTALWAWTGELVGACTRKGTMPALWQSVVVPGGRARNARYLPPNDPSKRRFHDDMTIPPQDPGALGRLYLDAVRRQTQGLRGPVLDQLAAAATAMSDRVRAGGAVHAITQSHFTTFEIASPAKPAWIRADYESRNKVRPADVPQRLADAMKPGDLFFVLGYYTFEPAQIEAVRTAGGRSIVTLCHAPPITLQPPQPDALIDAQWDYGDAAVAVPRYDIRILPSSAVLQVAVFWSVVIKAESLLAAPTAVP